MSSQGALAEQFAARYLQQQGLTLITQNYRIRAGEIDLIMQDGASLVFVEVRMRSKATFGGAAASIDAHKQRRLILAAQHYLASLPRIPPCRFDALLMEDAQGLGLHWLKNAFSA
ncbi:MAG: YraN family protein [Gallionella sp.]